VSQKNDTTRFKLETGQWFMCSKEHFCLSRDAPLPHSFHSWRLLGDPRAGTDFQVTQVECHGALLLHDDDDARGGGHHRGGDGGGDGDGDDGHEREPLCIVVRMRPCSNHSI